MKKIFLSAVVVTLLAAGCGKKVSQPNPPPAPAKPANAPVAQITKSDAKLITVTQRVYENGKKVSGTFTIAEGQDALALLRSFRTVETKTYSGVGEFVTSIDGIKPDSQHFWKFYVNGKSSNLGAGSYKIKDRDILEWKLELISSGE